MTEAAQMSAPEPPWYGRVPFDVIGKALALVGAIFYGVLFVAYRLYFSELNLRPEDGGIDNSFLAPRAVGLALICLLFFGALLCFFYYYVITAGQKLGVIRQLSRQAVGLGAGAVLYYALSFTLPTLTKTGRVAVALGVIVACQLAGKWIRKSHSADERSSSYALRFAGVGAILVAFVFPAIAICVRSNELGVRASRGEVIDPIELFAIPVVDVQTREVMVEWNGPNRPRDPFGAAADAVPLRGILLAREPASITILTESNEVRRIFRLQASSVTVSYVRES